MPHEAKQTMETLAAFPQGEIDPPRSRPSEPPEIMSLISRRSSPGVIMMGAKGEILLMNQQADAILKKIRGERGPFSKTEEGKLIKRLQELRIKILDSLSEPLQNEGAPVCDLLALRGTTFSLRGILLEGAGQEQAPVMVLIEPIQERSGSSPAVDEIRLTKREEEICHLISQGLINKEIASALGIGVHTVKDHVKKVMRKLNATTRAGIVAKIAAGGRTNGARPAK